MKHSKRYIKKQEKRELINKKALRYIIEHSNICKHAIKELNLAGYKKEKRNINNCMYQRVLEAMAVFTSHDSLGSCVPYEITLVQKLYNWDVISSLTFKDDEWRIISEDGTCQNIRKSSIFKDKDGNIHDVDAFAKQPIRSYKFNTKEWIDNKNPLCWNGGLFEHKNNILTGRYFSRCNIWAYSLTKGYTPKETRIIPCVEVEIAPDNWLMAVDTNDTKLLFLSCDYNIDWKDCPCMKDVRLEDVTPELENLAYEQIRNNK